jgi:hypothetical protein
MLPSTREHLFAFGILLAILVFFYRDVVFGGKTFLMEDITWGTLPSGPYEYQGSALHQVPIDPGAIAWVNEPYNRFISRSIQTGDFPLWNPYLGLAGAPIYSDGVMGPLEPIQFIFYWVPDRFWAYGVDIQLLVRFLLAGFFCYLFARRQKIGLAGGIGAGILFMLSSYFVRYGNHPQAKPELLLPIVLYCFDRLLDLKDKTGPWISALSVGWLILAAMPESTFFILFLASLWFFYNGGLILKQNQWNKQFFFAFLGCYFLAIIVGFLVSSIYLIPFFVNLMNAVTFHAQGTSLNEFYPYWSLSSLILQVYRPYLQGFVQNYLGFIPVFLALLALTNIKRMAFRREIFFFLAYITLFILINHNFPLTRWISKLPVFSQLIIAKYSIPSIMFCLAILAGIFIHTAAENGLSRRSVLIAEGLEFGIFIALPFLSNPKNFSSSFSNGNYIYIMFFFMLPYTLIAFFIPALDHFHIPGKQSYQFVLIFLICADPFFWSIGFTRPTRIDPYTPPPFVKFLQNEPEPFRIFSPDGFLFPNISSAYQIADVRWLYAIVDERAYTFSTRFIAPDKEGIRFNGIETPLSTGMFNLLNVKYLISHAKPETTGNVVYSGKDATIVEADGVLPRAFVVFNVVQANDFTTAIQLVSETPGVDSGQVAVVEEFPAILANNINRNTAELQPRTGEFKQINSGQVQVSVTTQTAGLLVISEQYSPDWKAELDGQSIPIYAVDGIFKGIYLPAGQHKVIFEYEPVSVKTGAVISFFMLGIIGYFLGRTIIESRRNYSRDNNE